MSDELPPALGRELERFLQPLALAARSDWHFGYLLSQLGFFPAAAQQVGSMVEHVRAAVDACHTIIESVDTPPESLAEAVGLLEKLGDFSAAIRGIGTALREVSPDLPAADVLGLRLLNYLTSVYLSAWHPACYELAGVLTLFDEHPSAEQEAVLAPDGQPVYAEPVFPQLQMDRLGALLKDPAGRLQGHYLPDGLATATAANDAADRLFPRLASLLRFINVSAIYGIDPDIAPDWGELGNEIAQHLLLVTVGPPPGEPGFRFGATVGLVAGERGGPGVSLAPFGAVDVLESRAGWEIGFKLEGGFEAALIGPTRAYLRGADTSGRAAAELGLRRLPTGEGPAVVIGGKSGTRLEIGVVEALLQLALAPERPDYGFLIAANSAALVIRPGDGDGFLAQVLPKEGLRADFELGLGWSNSRGVYFRGGGGLEATLPVNVTLLGVLGIDSVSLALLAAGDRLEVTIAATAKLTLGPVKAVVERVGLGATLSFPEQGGNVGVAELSLGFKPPDGAGLSIDATAVVGSGYLFFDPRSEQYAGIVQLEIAKTVAVKAIGLITTRLPDGSKGFSLLVIITVEGFTPIQLGFGFTLTGVGGLLGVHRTAMTDVLRAGIREGSLGSVLFPERPVERAPQIISDLRAVFPPARDRYLFGPMAIIGWGSPAIITLEIGLVLEIPQPVRLLILGRLKAILPNEESALIQLRMDALGVIDFEKGEFSLDATLYDSRILQFALTGDMAMRLRWGSEPNFMLSAGGFNPRCPPPAGMPRLERLSLSLATGDNPRLRFESYFAVTPNTLQFGARIDLWVSAAGFELAGYLGFDALIEFQPFGLQAQMGAGVALRRGRGAVLMVVQLDLFLTGPTPWHFWGAATFVLLGIKCEIPIEHQFGPSEPAPLPEPIEVLALLEAALRDVRNWSAALPQGEPPVVVFRDTGFGQALRVHPLGVLSVRQKVVPLNRTIKKYGNAPVTGAAHFAVTVESGTGERIAVQSIVGLFAPAQFEDFSDDAKLAQPAFVAMDAGFAFEADDIAYEYDPALDAAIDYETELIGVEPLAGARRSFSTPYRMQTAVVDAVAAQGAAAQAPLRKRGAARYRHVA